MPVAGLAANPQEKKDAVDERVEELTREFQGLDEELARVIAVNFFNAIVQNPIIIYYQTIQFYRLS